MVAYVTSLHRHVNIERSFGQSGAPWEFNLRDLLRWCDLLTKELQDAPVDTSSPDVAQQLAAAAAHYANLIFVHRLRTPEDQNAAVRVFAEAWPGNRISIAPKVDVIVSATHLQIGRAILSRAGPDAGAMPPVSGEALHSSSLSLRCGSTGVAALRRRIAVASTPALEWVATCTRMAWMALLVSPDVIAAAESVRLLASLASAPLVEIPLTPASDTSELLGGFEQLDPSRVLQSAASQVHLAASALCRTLLSASTSPLPFSSRLHLSDAIAGLLPEVVALASGGSDSALPALEHSVTMLRTVLERLTDACSQLDGAAEREGIAHRLQACSVMLDQAAALVSSMQSASIGGRFQWVDGLLLTAIEHGHWVMMLQPNLCSAAVLDRLNSLLEPRGFLYVNECGTTEQGPRIIRPHPAFRLFLVMNPADGEVSRAMRNRGIEIFVDAGDTPACAGPAKELSPLASLEMDIAGMGVPTWHIPAWMAHLHTGLVDQSAHRKATHNASLLRRWVSTTASLILHGYPLFVALSAACSITYCTTIHCSSAALAEFVHSAECSRVHALQPCTSAAGTPSTSSDLERASSAITTAPSARASPAHPLSLPSIPFVCDPISAASVASAFAVLQPLLVQSAQLACALLEQQALHYPADHRHALLCPDGPLGELLSRSSAPLPLSALADAGAGSSVDACRRACAVEVSVLALCVLESVPQHASAAVQAVAQALRAHLLASLPKALAEATGGLAPSFVAQAFDTLLRNLGDQRLTAASAAADGTHLAESARADALLAYVGVRQAPADGLPAFLRCLSRLHGHEALRLGAEESAAVAFAQDAPTPFQTSLLLRTPLAASVPRPAHKVIPLLEPFLAAIVALEERLLNALDGPDARLRHDAFVALTTLQDLRAHFFDVVHPCVDRVTAPASVADERAFLSHIPTVTYLARALIQCCEDGVIGGFLRADVAAQEQLVAFEDAAALLSDALALNMQHPLALSLWRDGGQPIRPRDLQAWTSWQRLQLLCSAAHVPPDGFTLNSHDAPALLDATSLLTHDDADDCFVPAETRRDAAESLAAVVGCSAMLRASLLRAASLMLVAAMPHHKAPAPCDATRGAGANAASDTILQLASEEAAALVDAVKRVSGESATTSASALNAECHGSFASSSGAALCLPYLDAPTLPAAVLLKPAGRRLQLALSAMERCRLSRLGDVQILCLASALCLQTSAPAAPSPANAHAASSAAGEQQALVADVGGLRNALRQHLADSVATLPARASVTPQALVPHQILAWTLDSSELAELPNALHMLWSSWHSDSTSTGAELPKGALVSMLTPLLPNKLVTAVSDASSLALMSSYVAAGAAGATHIASNAVHVIALAAQSKMPLHDLPVHRNALQAAVHHALLASASGVAAPAAALFSEVALLAALASRVLSTFAASCGSEAAVVADCALTLGLAAAEISQLQAQLPQPSPSASLKQQAAAVSSRAASVAARLEQLPLQPLRDLVQLCIPQVCSAVYESVAGLDAASAAGAAWTPPAALHVQAGTAWCLLGLMKVHLLIPPPGLDPADVTRQQRHHLEHTLQASVGPELRVRRAIHTLPLFPSQHEAVSALLAREAALQTEAVALAEQDVLRPKTSQYNALVSDCQRFVSGSLAVPSVQRLVDSLSAAAAAPSSQAAESASVQARVLDGITAAWADNACQRYPLYSDILGPLVAAMCDLRRGLQLLCARIKLNASAAASNPDASCVAASCLAFPMRLGAAAWRQHHTPAAARPDWLGMDAARRAMASASPLLPIWALTAPAVQDAVCAPVCTTVLALAAEVGSAMAPATLQTLPATLNLQLRLRSTLAACHACVPLADSTAHQPVVAAVHQVLAGVVELWRRGRELQAELSRREDAIFKTNAQRERVFTLLEEEEDEAAFRRDYRSMTTAFHDLMDGPIGDEDGPATAPEVAPVDDDEASMSAISQQLASALEDPAIQRAIVGMHAHVSGKLYADSVDGECDSFGPNTLDLPNVDDHVASLADVAYELGAAHLQSHAGYLENWVDEAACSGALRQILKRLDAVRVQARGKGGSNEGVDVSLPCLAEAQLAVEPVQALAARLRALLERFPDQPQLLQILAVCTRLLGLAADAPLKEAMVGVELLIGRVKTWQDHSASEREGTSLADLEAPLTGLAARWRRFELAGWRLLIDRILQQQRAQALKHWFHLYNILLVQKLDVASVLPVLEEFLQTCALGQFSARLALLEVFGKWCVLLTAGDVPAEERARLETMAVCLANVRAYYSQHADAVESELEGALAVVRKELKDYVKLEKWDRTGYHDLKITTERAQRKLHKCARQAAAASMQPVTPLFARISAKLGIAVVQGLSAGLSFDAIAPPEPPKEAPSSADDEPGDGSAPMDAASGAVPPPHALEVGKLASMDTAAKTEALLQMLPPLVEQHLQRVCREVVSGLEPASTSWEDAPPSIHSSLSNATLWRNRGVASLAARLSAILSVRKPARSHLPDALAVSTAAGEAMLLEANSAGCQMQALWAADGTKGQRSMRKKALVDYIKALTALGVSANRSAVPLSQRSPASWFESPSASHLPGFASRLTSAGDIDAAAMTQLQDAWRSAHLRYHRAVACTHALWERDNELHADISRREANQMKHQVEHMLYLMRTQAAAVLTACTTAADIGSLCTDLEVALPWLSAAGAASDGCDAALPAQDVCRDALPTLLDGFAEACRLLQDTCTLIPTALEHLPLQDVMRSVKSCLSTLLPRLVTAHDALRQALRAAAPIRLVTASSHDSLQPLIFTPAVVDAMSAAFAALFDASAKMDSRELVESSDVRIAHSHGPLTLSGVVPGWRRAACLLQSLAAEATSFTKALEAAQQRQPQDDATKHISSLADNLEAALNSILKWAQAIPLQDAPVAPEADADATPDAPTASATVLRLSSLMSASAACAIARPLACSLADAVAGVCARRQALPRALWSQLAHVASMASMAGSALRALVVHSVLLHSALGHLALMSTAIFVAYMRDGFGKGESEEAEGEGEGEGGDGIFKEQEGTGLGDGDTSAAKDVSEQIENEDQIMGAQTKDQQNAEAEKEKNPNADDADDTEGIDMQQDFDGDLNDVPKDEPGEDGEEEEAPELDKEFGDAGDEADVVDEKMWEGEDPEDEQDASKKEAAGNDKATNERGDPADRKMVAGERDDSEDERAQPEEEQHGEGGDEADKNEGGEPEGEVDPNEIAAQMAQDDHVQPQEAPPEFELDDNLNLDEEMDQDEQDGGDVEGGDVDEDQQPVIEKQREGGGNDEDMGDDAPEDGTKSAEPDDADGDAPMETDEGNDEDSAGAPDDAQPLEDQDAENDDGEKQAKEPADPVPAPLQDERMEEQPAEGFGGPQGVAAATSAEESRPDQGAQPSQPLSAPDQAASGGGAEQQEPANAEAAQAAGAAGAQGGDEAPRQPLKQDAPQSAAPTAAPEAGDAQSQPQRTAANDANPFRNLGDALERWKAKLNVTQDAAKEEGGGGDDDGAPDAQEGLEYEFLPADQPPDASAPQTLAASTQQQAAQQAEQLAGMDTENAAGSEDKAHEAAEELPEEDGQEKEGPAGRAERAMLGRTGGQPQAQLGDETAADGAQPGDDVAHADADLMEGVETAEQASHAVARLETDGPPVSGSDELLLAEMDALLHIDAGRETEFDDLDAERGRNLWQRCQNLTAGLTGELVEQLRLVLEPTLASRLSGDYKTGKRINMKKVIGYIASNFRKDKIWLRRTKPDKRRYQVVVAIDETRSMQENRCALFALEALALITSAMTRLEVGSLGVVGFGGSGGPRLLHALDQPWTDAHAQTVMGQLRFNEDNTLRDVPVLDMMRTVHSLLQRERHTAAAASSQLSQLLLIVADGRFHEKDALWRIVREAGQERSLLIAFIILDTHGESVMDLQSVTFEDGRPVFKKYLDSFPFPFYLVLQDIQHLPRLLADLLRQWLVLSSG